MSDDHRDHPEITSISIEGLKSIERIQDLPLRPINVLIGANGSGKSNFIGVFSLLQAERHNTVNEYVERSGAPTESCTSGRRSHVACSLAS